MPIHSDPTKMEEGELIYALDIGTRSVIGMLGALEQGRIRILALEKQPHARRAMLDGQIEDIDQVAGAVSLVTHRLEEASGLRLTCASVAAAGRALRTELGRSTLELSAPEALGHERIHQLEATAVANAEQALSTDGPPHSSAPTIPMGNRITGIHLSGIVSIFLMIRPIISSAGIKIKAFSVI